MKQLNNMHHSNLIEKLESAEFISITCDFWSNRTSKSFLVITGHYLSRSFELHSTVIEFAYFQKRHFSENIANVIHEKLDRLNIFDCVTAVTCDGASNMKKAFDMMGTVDRLWCLGHRLHLIVTNALGFWLKDTNEDVNDTIDDPAMINHIDDGDDLDSQGTFNEQNDDLAVIDDDEENEMVVLSMSHSITQM